MSRQVAVDYFNRWRIVRVILGWYVYESTGIHLGNAGSSDKSVPGAATYVGFSDVACGFVAGRRLFQQRPSAHANRPTKDDSG